MTLRYLGTNLVKTCAQNGKGNILSPILSCTLHPQQAVEIADLVCLSEVWLPSETLIIMLKTRLLLKFTFSHFRAAQYTTNLLKSEQSFEK